MTKEETKQFILSFCRDLTSDDIGDGRLMQSLIPNWITEGLLAEYADDQRRTEEHIAQDDDDFHKYETGVYESLNNYHIARMVGESDMVIIDHARTAARSAGRCWYLAVTQHNEEWCKAVNSALKSVHKIGSDVCPWCRT